MFRPHWASNLINKYIYIKREKKKKMMMKRKKEKKKKKTYSYLLTIKVEITIFSKIRISLFFSKNKLRNKPNVSITA